jgi:hypothetical protein
MANSIRIRAVLSRMRAHRDVALFATAAALALAAAGCLGSGGHAAPGHVRSCRPIARSGATTVPRVVGAHFDTALRALLRRGLLVSVPRFIPFHDAMAEQGWGRLGNYLVVSQSPAAGLGVARGRTVALTLDRPVFRGQLGSMVEPTHHPRYARIPNLVGDDYTAAMGAATERSGILVRVSTTGPLRPRASACGLDAFVVSSQTPRPGTRVLWGGVERDGVDPARATVTITLVSRAPAR